MSSREKQKAEKKPLWQNPVLLICAGVVLVFGIFYYTQRGDSSLTPKPYEYNPTTNKYWDPEHKHWHDGPPPLTPSATGSQTPAPATGTQMALPAVPTGTTTPKPYEYNPATNKYWDPSHGHWHDGQPPSPESQQAVNAVPPVVDTETHKPYEYDAVKNQYWDPNHKHWHNGKPPNQTLIPPINPGGK